MLLLACITVFAQQTGAASLPTSAETKQNAQQTLTDAKTNASQFESTLDDIKARITSNNDAATYRRLKGQIDQLEARIKSAQAQVQTEINSGHSVSASMVDQIQRLLDQHRVAMANMEAFASR